MQSKVNYILVGLFVIALVGGLSLVVFWLTMGTDQKVYDYYRVYFSESVAGLNPKATVRYRGVAVGQVETIRLNPTNPDQVDVVLGIERGTPISRDTIATLSTRGLTGVASVELSGSVPGSPPLEKQPDQDLPMIQAGPSLVARLDDAFNNILTNVNGLSDRLERLLSDENQQAFTNILRSVDTVANTIAKDSDSIDRSLRHVESLTAELLQQAQRVTKTLNILLGDLDKSGDLGSQVRKTLLDFQAGAQTIRRMIDNFDKQTPKTLDDFRAAAQAIRKTAEAFDKTSRDISGAAEIGERELRRFGEVAPPTADLLVEAKDLVQSLQRLADFLEQNPRALLLGKPTGRPGPGEK